MARDHLGQQALAEGRKESYGKIGFGIPSPIYKARAGNVEISCVVDCWHEKAEYNKIILNCKVNGKTKSNTWLRLDTKQAQLEKICNYILNHTDSNTDFQTHRKRFRNFLHELEKPYID